MRGGRRGRDCMLSRTEVVLVGHEWGAVDFHNIINLVLPQAGEGGSTWPQVSARAVSPTVMHAVSSSPVMSHSEADGAEC